jgi:hypothetical protein
MQIITSKETTVTITLKPDSRICYIDGVRYISAFDVITSMTTRNADTCRRLWSRMASKIPHKQHKFAGQGARETPVVDPAAITELVSYLPRANDQRWMRQGPQLRPPKQEITAVAPAVAPKDDKPPRKYENTFAYVRMRLPTEHTRPLTNSKELTLDLLKFGIAYSLHDRDKTYPSDNGFFAYAFSFNSRKEADVIESILKVDFADAIVQGSKEYVNSTMLAKVLGVANYDYTLYEHYAVLAQKLYVHIVKRAKEVWNSQYTGIYGSMFGIRTKQQTLYFSCTILTPERARCFGIPIDAVAAIPSERETVVHAKAATSTESDTLAVPNKQHRDIRHFSPQWPAMVSVLRGKFVRGGDEDFVLLADVYCTFGPAIMWNMPEGERKKSNVRTMIKSYLEEIGGHFQSNKWAYVHADGRSKNVQQAVWGIKMARD